MPTFKVAHIQRQGQNMLLFPLNWNFAHKSLVEQNSVLRELEHRAHSAGLAGSAAVFWEIGGRTHFLGPKPWRDFLQSMSVRTVLTNVNKSVSW